MSQKLGPRNIPPRARYDLPNGTDSAELTQEKNTATHDSHEEEYATPKAWTKKKRRRQEATQVNKEARESTKNDSTITTSGTYRGGYTATRTGSTSKSLIGRSNTTTREPRKTTQTEASTQRSKKHDVIATTPKTPPPKAPDPAEVGTAKVNTVEIQA